MNHLAQIGLAAQQWAENHGDRAPTSLLELKPYLAPMILVCPSAAPRSLAMGWNSFNPADITYRVIGPGIEWLQGPSRTFATCPIHGTFLINRDHQGEGMPSKYYRYDRRFIPNTRLEELH